MRHAVAFALVLGIGCSHSPTPRGPSTAEDRAENPSELVGHWRLIEGVWDGHDAELDLHPDGFRGKKSKNYEIDGPGWYVAGPSSIDFFTCFSDDVFTYTLHSDVLTLVAEANPRQRLVYKRVSREPRYLSEEEEAEFKRSMWIPGMSE